MNNSKGETRMRHPFIEQLRRSRALATAITVAITIGLVLSGSAAQAKVDPAGGGPQRNVTLSEDAVAKVTGGGTVFAKPQYPTTVASFGLNARRPSGFVSGGAAEGRIEYDRHINMSDRHVNVPVIYMQAEPVPQPPNQTGGDALLLGDCSSGTCPSGINSVFVYVNDVSDSGAGQDIFNIYFCTAPPAPPPPGFVPGGLIGGCSGPEGDVLRSGNIQVRGEAAIVGETITTAAGAGAFSSTPNINGVELAGGTFGIGLRTAGAGDLEAQFNGVNPLLGLFQQVTVSGWITNSSTNGGTTTFSGTASLNMGDGTASLSGLAVTGSLSASGLTLTVGSWSLGTLPVSDGAVAIQ
jgi:hypothetical protein